MTDHRPRLHRDPPTSPRLKSEYDILAGKGALIDDGYLVEPEPLDPRVPEPHRPLPWVGIGCGMFAGIWLAALVLLVAATLDATPRGGSDGAASSAPPALLGAPHVTAFPLPVARYSSSAEPISVRTGNSVGGAP